MNATWPKRGVQAWLWGDCVEAAWLALPFRALAVLGEGQEPQSARRDARGRGGLAFATLDRVKKPTP